MDAGQTDAVTVTEPAPVESTEPIPDCPEKCLICGLCTDEACGNPVSHERCPGHQEAPFSFPQGDYITTADISCDTGSIVFDIGQNIYVPGNLESVSEAPYSALESASNLNFDGNGYGREHFQDGRIHCLVSRDQLYVNEPWYTGSRNSEVGAAFADSYFHAAIAPGDLYIVQPSSIAHELAHVLMFRQSEWSHCQLLDEGFAEYTAYKALLELEKTKPEAAFYLGGSEESIYNMAIYDYSKLYEHPIEYWFENTFEYSGNENYTIGFRFMAYLESVYGDYSKWISEFEQAYCLRTNRDSSDADSVEHQLDALKTAYGDDVFDLFYPWLLDNEKQFNQPNYPLNIDLRCVDGINLYPTFCAGESVVRIQKLQYSDLYINLETVRKYLSEYKSIDPSELKLVTSEPVVIYLYQADGAYTAVKTNVPIPLEGISYIKLVGEGALESLLVTGFPGEEYYS